MDFVIVQLPSNFGWLDAVDFLQLQADYEAPGSQPALLCE